MHQVVMAMSMDRGLGSAPWKCKEVELQEGEMYLGTRNSTEKLPHVKKWPQGRWKIESHEIMCRMRSCLKNRRSYCDWIGVAPAMTRMAPHKSLGWAELQGMGWKCKVSIAVVLRSIENIGWG